VEPAIDVMAGGLVTRGVLLDIPRLRGVPFLEPGEAVGVEELRRAANETGAALEPGDVLLIRSGRWLRRTEVGAWDVDAELAGLDPDTLPWLREQDLAALGCDGVSDVLPSRVDGVRLPIHEIALVAMGMHLLDNLDLEVLSAACAAHRRWTFLLVIAPLVIRFGTASPVNPIEIF
jgi:kynurenine formamidase